MNHYVGDAHALFWYLTASPRLGPAASAAFAEADAGNARMHVPVIVLAEVFYLNEKLKRPVDFRDAHARMTAAPAVRPPLVLARRHPRLRSRRRRPRNARPHHRRPRAPARSP